MAVAIALSLLLARYGVDSLRARRRTAVPGELLHQRHPGGLVANWLSYANGRSLLIGVLFHAVSNAVGELSNAGQVAKSIPTLVWALIAIAVIVFDRAIFAGGPRNVVEARPPASGDDHR
jgi:hypothetical protein